ncbi:hypothetical protein [Geodermatophilus sp. DSM 45219]|uniref:hypothetical protein n=1 Tax=Geodermatophilus sp. DSM 45219 TaxID=1881103 RepID=UPI000885B01A|nr:hypothetical protein [Geodermatophilus sp. DSM 45219]SDO31073.1 hypothetical protein SAMN05428965_3466 [Geodermatophilus sp. DSM 45219]
MISTMWTSAPAGIRGPVGVAVRAADCAVESPLTARLRAVPATVAVRVAGTRVPAPAVFGSGVFGTRVLGTDVGVTPPIDALGATDDHAQQVGTRTTTEHNGTTLGIHSPRRPAS